MLVADPRRIPGADQQLQAGGLEPYLLGQLPPGRSLGLLALFVERPGGELEHQGIDRGPVLADKGHGPVVVHRDDGDGTGVAHDEAVEGPAVGIEQVEPVHPEQPGPEELLLRDAAEPRHVLGDGVEVEQVGLAPVGPFQRGRNQLTEQGVGPVGSALEFRVGLRGHPVRVLLQLDEFDQPAVR